MSAEKFHSIVIKNIKKYKIRFVPNANCIKRNEICENIISDLQIF